MKRLIGYSLMFVLGLVTGLVNVLVAERPQLDASKLSPIPTANAGVLGGYDRTETTAWSDGPGGRCVMNTETGALSCYSQCR